MTMNNTLTRRTLMGAAVTASIFAAGAVSAQETFKVGAINENGGVLGKTVEIVKGNATNPQEGISAVEQLATRDNVDVLIGTYLSSVAGAASETALNYNKLYWDTNALASVLTERGLPNFMRSGPYSATFAQVSIDLILQKLVQELGKEPADLKVWIEHEDSVYGSSIADYQEETLKAAGVQVVGVCEHSFRSIDL